MIENTLMTDVNDFLSSLRAGVFEQKIAQALSDVALGVVHTGKQGSVTLTFTLKQISESQQVTCAHKIAFSQPTKNGKRAEEDTTDTPLHVGRGGKLSLFPENQAQLFTQRGEVATHNQE